MRTHSIIGLLIAVSLGTPVNHARGQTTAQPAAAAIAWTDVTRDVYVGGRLDRTIQVFASEAPKRLALVEASLDRVVVLDLTSSLVGTLPKTALRISADGMAAASDAKDQMDLVGILTLPEESKYSFDFSGTSYLITPHKGLVGEVSEEEIWKDVPFWHTLMDRYRPDASAVAGFRRTADTTIIVAAGTWCGDSKRYVPQLLRALHEAGNPHLRVKVVGIANKFVEPAAFITQRNIKKVPTVIVEQNGREIGRVIETPVARTMEEDILAILNGRPNIVKEP